MQTIRCRQGKHRFRENNFGVVWCIDCGQLSNTMDAKPLNKKIYSQCPDGYYAVDVLDNNSCEGCHLYNTEEYNDPYFHCAYPYGCKSNKRADNKNVIFKKIR